MLINKLRGKKGRAMECGIEQMNEVAKTLGWTIEVEVGGSANVQKFLGFSPIQFCDFLFKQKSYEDYISYSMLVKHYEKLCDLVTILYILVYAGIVFLLYTLFKFNALFWILAVILGFALVYILDTTQDSYKTYYKKTLVDLILKLYKKISFTFPASQNVKDDDIKNIISQNYSTKLCKNKIDFSYDNGFGNINDMELTEIRKYKDKKTGNEISKKVKVFDGFYLKIYFNNSLNMLRGNIIKIKDDENILSSLAEDTVKGIYESDLEFNFNSEELNKSFDCKLTGYKGFIDADDALMAVHKIITPSFEQHLLYLRKRYNSFNMNISDNSVVASFDMKRDFFQKIKHGELIEFNKSYREANLTVEVLKGKSSGMTDFAYHYIFPFVERLYLINYLKYLYLSSMDFNFYFGINNDSINSFEHEMEGIYNMDIKEFKNIHIDKLERIKGNFKENLENFKNGRGI